MKTLTTSLLALVCTASAHGAEWTPVFEYLQYNKQGDDGMMLDGLIRNIFVHNIYENNYKKINPLTKYAQIGSYPIITPYKKDLKPAIVYKNPNKYTVLRAVIPLQNATLYGLPIQEFHYEYYCFECGGVGFSVKFSPMSNTQYQSLKKRIQFKQEQDTICDSDLSASFSKHKNNVFLNLHISC